VETITSPWETHEKNSDVIYGILSDILAIPSNVHDSIQTKIHDILRKHGQTARMEHKLPKYHVGSARPGYIDVVSLSPIRIGIEVDHTIPRHKSIEELNYFQGELSIIVLKGDKAGRLDKTGETSARCAKLKTQYAVLDMAEKKMLFSGPAGSAKK
jgi:hypothetical protein